MKPLRAVHGLLIVFGLAGCAAPYVPPPANPSTAGLDITVHNLFGHAVLKIDTGLVEKQTLLTTNGAGKTVTVQTTVSTAAAIRLTYQEFFSGSQCSLEFKFQGEPAEHYALFIGDAGPAAAKTGIGKFGQWLFPAAGKSCFAKVWQKQAGGGLVEVPLQKAFY